jgi:hypothetical protein
VAPLGTEVDDRRFGWPLRRSAWSVIGAGPPDRDLDDQREAVQRLARMVSARCPRCGVKLLHPRQSHACGPFSAEAFLAGRTARERELCGRFVALIAAAGPYELAPARTRIAFLAEVRFASVNRLGPKGLDVHLVLPRRLRSARFRKVEQLGPLFVHHLRFTAPGQLDAEVAGWVATARAEYGERRWLDARRGRLRSPASTASGRPARRGAREARRPPARR